MLLARPDAGAEEFSDVFVLGDSLSDSGNAAAALDAAAGVLGDGAGEYTFGLCNPADVQLESCGSLFFEMSRITNGPVAVEHLAQGLGFEELLPSWHVVTAAGSARPDVFGTNYAVGSAKARGSGPEDLTAQVDALLRDRIQAGVLPSEALYVVAIGGNDAIDALQAAGAFLIDEERTETPAEVIDAAVDAIARNVERLVGSGARYVLVLNVPNIGAAPAVREAVDGLERIVVRRIAALVARMLNTDLALRLADVQQRNPAMRADVFDLYTAFELERMRAFLSGRNYDDACFDSEIYFYTGERAFHEDCAPQERDLEPDYSNFVFWDALHPTGSVHAEIGAALVEASRDLLNAR